MLTWVKTSDGSVIVLNLENVAYIKQNLGVSEIHFTNGQELAVDSPFIPDEVVNGIQVGEGFSHAQN
jgi:hypothetical protein